MFFTTLVTTVKDHSPPDYSSVSTGFSSARKLQPWTHFVQEFTFQIINFVPKNALPLSIT